MRIPIVSYFFVLTVAITHSAYYYPYLPEQMASHFGTGGSANSWSTRPAYFLLESVLVIIVFAAFIGLPLFMRRFRIERINIPNREYWMAPERRGIVFEIIGSWFCWFAVIHLAFVIVVNQIVFNANLYTNGRLDSSALIFVLALFLGFVIIWLLLFFLKFKRTGG